jgi:hypothetical protein
MDYVDATSDIESITRHDGFFDTLRQPESLLHLKNFMSTPGVRGTSVGTTLGEYRALQEREGPLLSFGWRDSANKVADFILGRDVEVVGEEQRWLPFRVHTLYCPAVPGAEATLSICTEKESTASGRLSIAGVGGGPDFSIAMKMSSGFKTKEKSISITYEFETVWEHCNLIAVDGSRTSFPRLKELRRNSRRTTPRLVTPSQPRDEWGAVAEREVIDLRNVDVDATQKLEISAGTEWEASAEIEIFGVTIGPKYTLAMKWTTELEYVLPKGYSYVARRYEKMPWWWWSLEDLEESSLGTPLRSSGPGLRRRD